jgi:hypothetical protein
VIEEVSQIDLQLWTQLQKLKHCGVRFLAIGDWNQFPPVGGHTWAGELLADTAVETSNLLKILCDNNRICLTTPRRSDVELFNYYASLIPGGVRFDLPLLEVLAEARARFPVKPGFPDLSLVISHRLRQSINRRQNRALAPPDALPLQTAEGEVLLHVGLHLIASLPEKTRNCVNGGSYTVKEVGEEVILECEASQRETLVPLSFICSHMRLAFSCTIASIQGQTCTGRLRVYTKHERFTLKHLFVCSSRATNAANLELV